jgi:hypothetical protein
VLSSLLGSSIGFCDGEFPVSSPCIPSVSFVQSEFTLLSAVGNLTSAIVLIESLTGSFPANRLPDRMPHGMPYRLAHGLPYGLVYRQAD